MHENPEQTLKVILSFVDTLQNNARTAIAMLEMAEARGIPVDQAAVRRILEPYLIHQPREGQLINMGAEMMQVVCIVKDAGLEVTYDELNTFIDERRKVEEGKEIYGA